MVSRNKLTICRLCLSENECFINIFEMNDWQGYVAAEVISDLLRFQVSETDVYPHVVCLACLSRLTDFKQFKERCQRSKVKYDEMFFSHESLVEHKSETMEYTTVKAEPICYSHEDDDPKDIGDGGCGLELYEKDPLTEEASDPIVKQEELDIDSSVDGSDEPLEGTITKASFGPIPLKDEVISFNMDRRIQEQLTHTDQVTHPQRSEQRKTHRESKGAFDADSSTSANDKSMFENSNNVSSSVGGRIYVSPLFQQDLVIKKEGENNSGEVESETALEGRVGEERERLECFHCGNVFTTMQDLMPHMALHGFVNSCESFSEDGSLKNDMKSLPGSKPFKCGECTKSFYRNFDLNRHMRIHTGSKPYKCAECRKSFSDNGNLIKHMRRQICLKSYKCAE